MLEQILIQVQDFEQRYGQHPTVVFVNQRDYAELRSQYPDIFQELSEIMLGFHIKVVPNEVLSQPEPAWLPMYAESPRALIEQALSMNQPILQDLSCEISVLH